MRLRFLMAVIAVGLAAAPSSAAADANDAERLRGFWIAVSAERNGEAADDLRGHQLTFFASNRFIIRSKGKLPYQGTFRVDPSKKPATIDFKHSRGEAMGKAWLGIYLLEGDVLKICDNADDLGKGRPAAFATEPGSGRVLVTFKREVH